MGSATGTARTFDSRAAAVGGDRARLSTPHLASDATFGVAASRGPAYSKVSMLGLVLASKKLKPVRRVSARRGPAVAQGHCAAREMSGGRSDRDDDARGLEREMTTRITQIEEQGERDATLKVEGSLTLEDARILEEVCEHLRGGNGRVVRIDLAGLSFLDDESATLLRRLKRQPGILLEGAHLFVREVIEQDEPGGGD